MREIAVRFGCGRDLLEAYWGFLSHGGLVIRDDVHDLSEGEAIALDVTIESSSRRHRLRAQVVRRRRGERSQERAVIAFLPGEPQDLLLSAAWSDANNVPARRFTRFAADGPVAVGPASQEAPNARLLNVSRGGCCVRARPMVPATVGDRLAMTVEATRVPVTVRWVRGAELGLEFDAAGERGALDAWIAGVAREG